MRYDISKATAPAMPNLGKGTEIVKLLLSQASKDMYEPLVPMFFPPLGAHISCAEFQYPDLTWKEMCGQMAHLVANSGCNKGQLGNLVEAICRDFLRNTRPLLTNNPALLRNKAGLLSYQLSFINYQLGRRPLERYEWTHIMFRGSAISANTYIFRSIDHEIDSLPRIKLCTCPTHTIDIEVFDADLFQLLIQVIF
jgi:hypothetical protein